MVAEASSQLGGSHLALSSFIIWDSIQLPYINNLG